MKVVPIDNIQKHFKGNRAHIAVLLDAISKDDIGVWNSWKQKNSVLPDLRYANLKRARLTGIDFSGANLQHSNLQGAELCASELSGVNMSYCDLDGARFCHSIIHTGNFFKARLTNANLDSALLNNSNLSNAILTGAMIHGLSMTDWVLDGVICDFVYDKKRIPEGRNFAPCEFEQKYKFYPTFNIEYQSGFNALRIVVADFAAVQLNAESPDFNFEIKEVSTYGLYPIITVAVSKKEQVEEGKMLMLERVRHCEEQLLNDTLAMKTLLESIQTSASPPAINFNGPIYIDSHDSSKNTVYNITIEQIKQLEHQIDDSNLDAEVKSSGKKILSQLKEGMKEELVKQLIDWARSLTKEGIRQLPLILSLIAHNINI